MVSRKLSSQWVVSAIYTLSGLFFHLHLAGCVRWEEFLCIDSGKCPVNIYNNQGCLEVPAEIIHPVLEDFERRSHQVDVARQLACDDGFDKVATLPTDSVRLDVTFLSDLCQSGSARLKLLAGDLAKVAIVSTDHGESEVFDHFVRDDVITFGLRLRVGRSITLRIILEDRHGLIRAFQCFYPLLPVCMDARLEEYEFCRSLLPSTSTTSTTTTTTTPPPTTTKPTVTTTETITTTTIPNSTITPALLTENTTSTEISPQTVKVGVRTRPAEQSAGGTSTQEEATDRSGLWKALFISVGAVAGAMVSGILLVIITKFQSHRRAKEETEKFLDSTCPDVQHSESLPMNEVHGIVPERFSNLTESQPRGDIQGVHRTVNDENIYTAIKDEDVESQRDSI